MSSGREAADAGRVEAPPDPVCDRCGDPIPAERVIFLSSEPCAALADRYDPVTATYCPDCIAGIGMLALGAETRAPASMEAE
ncbi:hypothetical protein [Natrarchaeobius chitinivorans]|uniref:Uncharacterized protein n=1 Tax=Natrarchaeobius chitinivorans TaxID=1679083 RepID=A0A3N6LUA1_NATCH|nr:hypothetical protein [Natrarchaeobius chitinivorans]RQG93813.1 hypothetical protein EA473_13930 [Natrarchaeobius chitinivorans]